MSNSHLDDGYGDRHNGLETNSGKTGKRHRHVSSSSDSSEDFESSRHRYSHRDYNRHESSSSSSRHAKNVSSKSDKSRYNDQARKHSNGLNHTIDRQRQFSSCEPMELKLLFSNEFVPSKMSSRTSNREKEEDLSNDAGMNESAYPFPAMLPMALNNDYIEPYNPVPLKGLSNIMPMYIPASQSQQQPRDPQQLQLDAGPQRNSLIYIPTQEKGGHYRPQIVKRARFDNNNNNGNLNRSQFNCNLMISPIPILPDPMKSIVEHFGRFGRLLRVDIEPLNHANERAYISYSTHQDALNARRSIEPFLNNRFIEVLWDNRPYNNSPKPPKPTSKMSQAMIQSLCGEQQQPQPPLLQTRPIIPRLSAKQREERTNLQKELDDKLANVQLIQTKLSNASLSSKQQQNLKNILATWLDDVQTLTEAIKKIDDLVKPIKMQVKMDNTLPQLSVAGIKHEIDSNFDNDADELNC